MKLVMFIPHFSCSGSCWRSICTSSQLCCHDRCKCWYFLCYETIERQGWCSNQVWIGGTLLTLYLHFTCSCNWKNNLKLAFWQLLHNISSSVNCQIWSDQHIKLYSNKSTCLHRLPSFEDSTILLWKCLRCQWCFWWSMLWRLRKSVFIMKTLAVNIVL